jgi:hypothetical protein
MPVKVARSAPRPLVGLPELLVAIHTSRQSCSKAGKAQIFALVGSHPGNPGFNVPGQQFGHAGDRVVGDAAEQVAQIDFGGEAVEHRAKRGDLLARRCEA